MFGWIRYLNDIITLLEFLTIIIFNRAVYEELGKYGDLDNQVLCRERVEELEPSIRYCLHKIGQSNLQTSELLNIGDMEGPALDLFKAKLEVGTYTICFNYLTKEKTSHVIYIYNIFTNQYIQIFLLRTCCVEVEFHFHVYSTGRTQSCTHKIIFLMLINSWIAYFHTKKLNVSKPEENRIQHDAWFLLFC
jgi:hypothetical protein